MQLFTVTWVIDVEAESPEGAAIEALNIQRDPTSIATIFMVQEYRSPAVLVDTQEI
jgi:hypothetical protein